MYVVVMTKSCEEKGEAFACENKEEGVEKMEEIFMGLVKKTKMLDKFRTKMSQDEMYAEVWSMMGVTKLRMMEMSRE